MAIRAGVPESGCGLAVCRRCSVWLRGGLPVSSLSVCRGIFVAQRKRFGEGGRRIGRGVGRNFERAAKLANALPHSEDANSGARRFGEFALFFRGDTFAIVGDGELQPTGAFRDADFRFRGARVAVNVREAFLNYAKQYDLG